MIDDDDYVLDDGPGFAPIRRPPAGHVAEAPAADMTWQEFARAVIDLDAAPTVKCALTTLIVQAGGETGVLVDWDGLAASVDRSTSTIRRMLVPVLRDTGWIAPTATLINGRAVVEWRTARSVNG